MSDAVLLTASIIRKAEAQDQEYALSDAKQPGLLLRVQPSGAKSWCIRLGNKRITVRSLDVVRVDADNNLLLVKGPVPGHNNAWVEIRPATRLYRSKAAKA